MIRFFRPRGSSIALLFLNALSGHFAEQFLGEFPQQVRCTQGACGQNDSGDETTHSEAVRAVQETERGRSQGDAEKLGILVATHTFADPLSTGMGNDRLLGGDHHPQAGAVRGPDHCDQHGRWREHQSPSKGRAHRQGEGDRPCHPHVPGHRSGLGRHEDERDEARRQYIGHLIHSEAQALLQMDEENQGDTGFDGRSHRAQHEEGERLPGGGLRSCLTRDRGFTLVGRG